MRALRYNALSRDAVPAGVSGEKTAFARSLRRDMTVAEEIL